MKNTKRLLSIALFIGLIFLLWACTPPTEVTPGIGENLIKGQFEDLTSASNLNDTQSKDLLVQQTGSLSEGLTIQFGLNIKLDAQPQLEINHPLDLGFVLEEYYYLGQTVADFKYHGQLTYSPDLQDFMTNPKYKEIIGSLTGLDSAPYFLDQFLAWDTQLTRYEANSTEVFMSSPTGKTKIVINQLYLEQLYNLVHGYEALALQSGNLGLISQFIQSLVHEYLGIDPLYYQLVSLFLSDISYQTTWGNLETITDNFFPNFFTASSPVEIQTQTKFNSSNLEKFLLNCHITGQLDSPAAFNLSGAANLTTGIALTFGKDNYHYLTNTEELAYLSLDEEPIFVPGYLYHLNIFLDMVKFVRETAIIHQLVGRVYYEEQPIYLYDIDDDGVYDVWSAVVYDESDETVTPVGEIIIYEQDEEDNFYLLLDVAKSDQPSKIPYTQVQDGYLTPVVEGAYSVPRYTFNDSSLIAYYGIYYDNSIPIFLYDLNNDGIFDGWASVLTINQSSVASKNFSNMTVRLVAEGTGIISYSYQLMMGSTNYHHSFTFASIEIVNLKMSSPFYKVSGTK
jgi:hypothetical protein